MCHLHLLLNGESGDKFRLQQWSWMIIMRVWRLRSQLLVTLDKCLVWYCREKITFVKFLSQQAKSRFYKKTASYSWRRPGGLKENRAPPQDADAPQETARSATYEMYVHLNFLHLCTNYKHLITLHLNLLIYSFPFYIFLLWNNEKSFFASHVPNMVFIGTSFLETIKPILFKILTFYLRFIYFI